MEIKGQTNKMYILIIISTNFRGPPKLCTHEGTSTSLKTVKIVKIKPKKLLSGQNKEIYSKFIEKSKFMKTTFFKVIITNIKKLEYKSMLVTINIKVIPCRILFRLIQEVIQIQSIVALLNKLIEHELLIVVDIHVLIVRYVLQLHILISSVICWVGWSIRWGLRGRGSGRGVVLLSLQ